MGLEDIDECDPPVQARPVQRPQPTNADNRTTNMSSHPNNSSNVKPVDLGDLFGDPQVHSVPPTAYRVATTTAHALPPQPQPQHQPYRSQQQGVTFPPNVTPAIPSSDPLDAFFSAPASSTQYSQAPTTTATAMQGGPSNDLFDFSKPAERARYTDERSFLEAFENQVKGRRGEYPRDGPSLADLSKGSSNNAVKARLLHMMNYYDVLGVTREATEEEIRQRYKRKALELHPDKVGRGQTPEEAELFKVMTKAHEVLCDPEERAKYDAELQHTSGAGDGDSNWFFHLKTQ